MMKPEQVSALALHSLNEYLDAYELNHGQRLDDVSGVDACAAMMSAVIGLLGSKIGEKRALLVLAMMVQQVAAQVPGARMDVVECDKLPETPQEAMAMSLEREAHDRDAKH